MSQPPPWEPPEGERRPPGHPPPVPPTPGPAGEAGDPRWTAPYGLPPPGQRPSSGSSPPRRGIPGWVWALVAVGVLALVGVGVVVVLVVVGLFTFEPASEEELSRLYDACADGDMESCDDLFRESPVGSEYEDFGDTCGGRTDGGTWCKELAG